MGCAWNKDIEKIVRGSVVGYACTGDVRSMALGTTSKLHSVEEAHEHIDREMLMVFLRIYIHMGDVLVPPIGMHDFYYNKNTTSSLVIHISIDTCRNSSTEIFRANVQSYYQRERQVKTSPSR